MSKAREPPFGDACLGTWMQDVAKRDTASLEVVLAGSAGTLAVMRIHNMKP